MNLLLTFLFLIFIIIFLKKPNTAWAAEREKKQPAIVLAAFGTSDVEAIKAILNSKKIISNAFPFYEIHLSFTSNIIRSIWHKRANDNDFKNNNPGLDDFYSICSPITCLALIQEKAFRPIFVQAMHITNGSEYEHLHSIVEQFSNITALQKHKIPFPYLCLSDSALGEGTEAELKRAARALGGLIHEAKADEAALVLMGHGNEHKNIKAYKSLKEEMRRMYQSEIYITLVEGEPSFEKTLSELKKTGTKNVILAPLMLVAGGHAKKDMAGDDSDSWASRLNAEGFKSKVKLEGLGLNKAWVDIYVERLKILDEKFKISEGI